MHDIFFMLEGGNLPLNG